MTYRFSIKTSLAALLLVTLLLAACGDDGAGSDSSGSATEPAAEGDQAAVEPAPDLTPDEVCSSLEPEALVAVVDGSDVSTDVRDGPPQCSIAYANSEAVREQGGANGTNLLVVVPTSEELEGLTGDAAIEVATEFAFSDGDPEPVDVADGGLTDGRFLYFATGGRVVGVAAGDGMTPEQLVEVAELAAESLEP